MQVNKNRNICSPKQILVKFTNAENAYVTPADHF
jgi:hypothetical protein